MGKLKMLVLGALAAATVGTGALTAAPSAFAQMREPTCGELKRKFQVDYNVWQLLCATGYGRTTTAFVYQMKWNDDDAAIDAAGC
jgi:hypothetical protein